jgi:hypothetical protein
MQATASLVLALMSLLQSPIAPLPINIVFSGLPIRPQVEATATQEVVSIWAPYGVEIHATGLAAAQADEAIKLVVLLADHQDGAVAPSALGSIRFRGGLPEPVILIYPHTVDAFVDEAPETRSTGGCAPARHDLLTGRMLGRAVAHEIGHFLLRSRYHSTGGLMRPRHPTRDLIAPEREAFGLSLGETMRLRRLATASAHD